MYTLSSEVVMTMMIFKRKSFTQIVAEDGNWNRTNNITYVIKSTANQLKVQLHQKHSVQVHRQVHLRH